jgi:hypothetical protein
MAAFACLCSPDTSAQQTRPLTVWVDSTRFNVCDGSKVFFLAVRVSPILIQDSVVSASLVLAWDVSKIDLEDQVVTSSETLGYQFDQKKVEKAQNGTMYIQLGNLNLRPVAGNKPLFFIKGIVKAPDTLGGLDGWIEVENTSVHLFGNTEFSPVESRTGFVRVGRDTTVAYTGRLEVATSSFDTARLDTVGLTIQNLKGRRVNEVSFALKADASNYEFIDTLMRGTIADSGWSLRDVTITPDSIGGRFVATSDLAVDGVLMKIILRRRNDSAFSSLLRVGQFKVNRGSCLGKLTWQDGPISAVAVPKPDTSTTGVDEEKERASRREIRVISAEGMSSLTIVGEGIGGMAIEIFDVVGTRLTVRSAEPLGSSAIQVRLATQPPSGTYFMVLRGRNEIVYKQFTFIK